MFGPIDPEWDREMYEMFGRKTDMLLAQLFPSEVIPEMPLERIQTSVPKWVVKGEMLPLVLINDVCVYEQVGIELIVKVKSSPICKVSVAEAVKFYSADNHVPEGGEYHYVPYRVGMGYVPLPPSRRDPRVTGQLKLLIDVALFLPYMRREDSVIVVGSANTCGTQAADCYRLMEGIVKDIFLYDPYQPVIDEFRHGTHVMGFAEEYKTVAYCTFFFNDAAISDDKVVRNVLVPFVAKYYSLKCAGKKQERSRVKTLYHTRNINYFEYVQLSDTSELRLTSHPRHFVKYVQRLGDCPACVEIDYHLPADFSFTDYQYQVIRDIHAYGTVECSLKKSSRPLSQIYVNTILMRTVNMPIYLTSQDPGIMSFRDEPYLYAQRDRIRNPDGLMGSTLDYQNLRYYFTHEMRLHDFPLSSEFDVHHIIHEKYRRQSVVFFPRGRRMVKLKFLDAETYMGLLVIDTYAYELDYLVIADKQSVPGLFPTECYLTKWWVSRFGDILKRGLNATTLMGSITVVLRSHQYVKFGFY